MMSYEVEVNGKVIKYGPYAEMSGFTEEERSAIYHEMVKGHQPSLYKTRKNDGDFIMTLGVLIDLEERYEALLELLPQSSFSKVLSAKLEHIQGGWLMQSKRTHYINQLHKMT